MNKPNPELGITVIVIILVVGIIVCLFALAAAVVDGASAQQVTAPSCATPAATWATLVACRTETARALTGAPQSTRTATATPTKVTPSPTDVPLVVYAKIVINGADMGIIQFREGQPIKIEIWRIDQFPRPTATVTSLP